MHVSQVGSDVLSEATSRRLLEALRPRLVVSAHTHRFCERAHAAPPTVEVTLPVAVGVCVRASYWWKHQRECVKATGQVLPARDLQ
jgi:hypothetical protein